MRSRRLMGRLTGARDNIKPGLEIGAKKWSQIILRLARQIFQKFYFAICRMVDLSAANDYR